MAGTVTQTSSFAPDIQGKSLKRLAIDWTSDASGNATATTDRIYGTLVGVAFIPSASAAPTTLYDVTLTDDNGVDVISGQGANLSATVANRVVPGVPFKDGTTTSIAPVALDDTLDLSVSNAGNAKSGTVVLYVR